jgi:hypothetical protein
VGAALTTQGHARIARWCGFGKRDEEEYARNQRDYVPRKVNRLKPGGYGPGAVRTRAGECRSGELPGRRVGVGLGGHGEALRGSRGDAAGIELGSYFVERITVNAGTVPILPERHVSDMDGRAGLIVGRSVRGGAEPS